MHYSCPLILPERSWPPLQRCQGGALRTLAAMAIQANMGKCVINCVNLASNRRPNRTRRQRWAI
ncbi:hypothetical protein C4K40_4828 [Pseudomonas sp. CMR5c]|nr:hypothetical protein C4K40_4828 [Pseudomonas sp. CMR5c]